MRKYADIIFVFNAYIREALIRYNFPEKKIFQTQNGVGIKIDPCLSKIYDGCFCGRLDRKKGIFDLIHAWKIVSESIPSAKLVMIGEDVKGKNLLLLKKLIKKLRLEDNVILTGFVNEHTMSSLFAKSRIFVLPSYEETWSLVIADAMSTGLPCIAYRLPVYEEIYRDTLIQVPMGDVKKLARSILNFLLNDELRHRFGEKSKKIVQKYDWKKIARHEHKVIQRYMFKRTSNFLVA